MCVPDNAPSDRLGDRARRDVSPNARVRDQPVLCDRFVRADRIVLPQGIERPRRHCDR
jgi:hypothetical protein